MNILDQLGLNHTYFYQLFIFVFALLMLSLFVFKDYVELLKQRNFMTKGSEELAEEFQKNTTDLHQKYETKARQVSGEIKTIFDNHRDEANKEYQGIITKAKKESSAAIDETRRRVSMEYADAAGKIIQESPLLAQSMMSKLLAKKDKGGEA